MEVIVDTTKGVYKEHVVRCKDCKYWRPHSQCGYDYENGVYGDYCSLLSPEDDFYAIATEANDYCSWGERKNDE